MNFFSLFTQTKSPEILSPEHDYGVFAFNSSEEMTQPEISVEVSIPNSRESLLNQEETTSQSTPLDNHLPNNVSASINCSDELPLKAKSARGTSNCRNLESKNARRKTLWEERNNTVFVTVYDASGLRYDLRKINNNTQLGFWDTQKNFVVTVIENKKTGEFTFKYKNISTALTRSPPVIDSQETGPEIRP